MIFNIKDEAMTSRFYKTRSYSNKKCSLLLPGIRYVDPSSSPEPRVCVCVSISAQSAKPRAQGSGGGLCWAIRLQMCRSWVDYAVAGVEGIIGWFVPTRSAWAECHVTSTPEYLTVTERKEDTESPEGENEISPREFFSTWSIWNIPIETPLSS